MDDNEIITTHLMDIKESLARLHDKVDGHSEKLASHATSISFFKAGFGAITAMIITTIAYIFRSHS